MLKFWLHSLNFAAKVFATLLKYLPMLKFLSHYMDGRTDHCVPVRSPSGWMNTNVNKK